MLKKQYGRYVNVATPNTVLCVIPHVFQGTSTEVTVTASSVVRLSSRRSYPSRSYISRNMLPVSNMQRYWSAIATLSITPVAAVELTSDVRPLTICINRRVMPPTMPPAAMHPPKHMAQMMSHIVGIMPAIPRVDTRSASMVLSEWRAVLPYTLFMAALNNEGSISRIASVWNTKPNTTASNMDRNRVMTGGILRAIISPVSTGTSSSHGVMLKRVPSDDAKVAISCELLVVQKNPATAKMMSAIVIEGTVVMSI